MKLTVKILLAHTVFLVLGTAPCLAAATLSQEIDPPEVHVGDQVTVRLTVENGAIKRKDTSTLFGMIMPSVDITLPPVDGLQTIGTSSQIMSINGVSHTTVIFTLVPTHSGDFTIPAFDVQTQDGQTLHALAMRLRVLGGAMANSSSSPAPAHQTPGSPVNPNGPVIMPPNNGPALNAANTTSTEVNVPMESNGRPAKVFIIITPKTTDAYVGQAVPTQIDFYIRMDVAAQQNSLPTIKGSDFLMNDLSIHPQENLLSIMNETFHRERWCTAISASKSGDFPLEMERDTYWLKTTPTNNFDPFSAFFRHASLAHEPISSNQLTIHVHALPTKGRPANFTGAIGQLKVTSDAQPTSVTVGEPVTLHFAVSGEGNFDYVRCPSLANDPAWKTYVPSSKMDYQDEYLTQGVKTFEQAVIPQKNGNLPLPPASFSYFDPTSKQYVTIPIKLPTITVTGTAAPMAAASSGDETNATTNPEALKASDFIPNRLRIGSLYTSLMPAYRRPWFWVIQGALLFAVCLGGILLFIRSRSNQDEKERAERLLRQRSLHHEEDAMSEAVRRKDVLAFFVAARHAVQLQLGSQWRLKPETLTLAEIRQRDPQLAETLEPLFTQADQIIYSGQVSPDLDLAQWELRVRQELLQPA